MVVTLQWKKAMKAMTLTKLLNKVKKHGTVVVVLDSLLD
jgi:hypothetical protein